MLRVSYNVVLSLELENCFSENIIAKSGTPLLKLSPIKPSPKMRTAGLSRGAVILEDDFFDPLPEDIIEEFEK